MHHSYIYNTNVEIYNCIVGVLNKKTSSSMNGFNFLIIYYWLTLMMNDIVFYIVIKCIIGTYFTTWKLSLS